MQVSAGVVKLNFKLLFKYILSVIFACLSLAFKVTPPAQHIFKV